MVIQHLRGCLKDPENPRPSSAVWKKVCFDDVHIREHPFIMGDNPSVSKGAPLTIDWRHQKEDIIDVDVFEHCRAPHRRHRRRIVLSARKRAKILLGAGFTVEDIADMTLQCQTVKKQRVESIKNQGQWETLESLGEFLSGTAEITGRTLQLVEFFPNAVNATGQAVGKMVLGTGTVAKDVVMGTGQMGKNVILGTGRVGKDVILGTGKVGYDVVMGTGKVATDVVVGTGKFVTTGVTEVAKGSAALVVGTGRFTGDIIVGTGKGIGKVGKRMTSIFSLGDVVRGRDLQQQHSNLRHVDRRAVSPVPNRRAPRRAQTDETLNNSPKRSLRNSPKSSPKASPMISPTRSNGKQSVGTSEAHPMMKDLDEMEHFVNQLHGMDPEKIKLILGDEGVSA